LFNLCHASAHNIIEQIFGVLKRRFRILLLAPEYNFNIQARIPAALCAIHNFNAKYDSNKVLLPENTLGGFDNCHDRVKSAGVEPERASDTSVDHDQIAEMMW
jgi:hypothetical protein